MTVFSELRMRPATAERWGWDASTTARLVMAGVVIFTLLVGANLATPLYPLLQAKLGISAFGITVAFSAYVLALVATLILAGHWSDHIGRRAALVLAVLVGLAGGSVGVATDLDVPTFVNQVERNGSLPYERIQACPLTLGARCERCMLLDTHTSSGGSAWATSPSSRTNPETAHGSN